MIALRAIPAGVRCGPQQGMSSGAPWFGRVAVWSPAWPAARAAASCAAWYLAFILSSGAALAQSNLPMPYSNENEWKELGVTPPAYPKTESLVKFPTTWTTAEVLVDTATLSIGDDTVVRYALVIKTAGGAENVTYEGLRCATGQLRVYAFGRRDRTWSPARTSDWRAIQDSRINRHHFEFWRDVFCDGKVTEPRAEILRNLQRGGRERPQFSPSD